MFAYFIDDDFVQNNVSSQDDNLLGKVMSDPSGMIEDFSPRFSKKDLPQAIKELIHGQEEQGYPFHYSFALWTIVDALAESKPKKPHIPYPFIDLYDFNELLEMQSSYPALLEIFKSLNYEIYNKFPYQLSEWGDMPCFAYIAKSELEVVSNEIKTFKSEVKAKKTWINDIESIEDITHVLSWIEQADKKKENLLLVMEGDL